MESNTIAQTVKAFVLEEFLPGENSSSIDETTPLISGGIIDFDWYDQARRLFGEHI